MKRPRRLSPANPALPPPPWKTGRPVTLPLTLLPREQALVRAAVKQDGWFRIQAITQATGESRDWVNRVARRWERMGYLTPVQRDAKGHPLGRKVTPALLQAAGMEAIAQEIALSKSAFAAPGDTGVHRGVTNHE